VRAPKTIAAAIALTAVTGLSVAACGSSSSNSNASTSPSAAATPSPLASLASVTGTSTAVKLDPGFLAALKMFKITPGVTGTAQLTTAGSLVFPITSGNVTYYKPGSVTPYVQGVLHHDGSGITLTAGTTKVGLSNFSVNPGTSMLLADVSVNGTTKAMQTPVFFLDGSTLQALDTTSVAGSAVLTGTQVKILPAAASLLDSAFGVPAGTVPNYLLVGVATITIKLPASS
jgi:hypothetical protein